MMLSIFFLMLLTYAWMGWRSNRPRAIVKSDPKFNRRMAAALARTNGLLLK